MTAKIIAANGALEFYTPYDKGMLADFKACIPAADRRWDGARKCWLVAAGQLPMLERLCQRHGLTMVKQLTALYDAPRTVQKILRVSYIGAPKEREDGSVTAMGYVNTHSDSKGRSTGDWLLVFPQDVLRAWFETGFGESPLPAATTTFYGLLGVKRDADAAAIKGAYRQMAKRWHPDVNRDPDATEMFKKIGHAYEVLADDAKRARYDVGLLMEATVKPGAAPLVPRDTGYWRPPVRCGLILVEGQERLGRLIAAKILAWQPIINAAGQELVTSWPMGNDTWIEQWV
jgi:hypothetical protein